MHRWLIVLLVVGLAGTTGAAEPEIGRTDGPEGSEIGTGGYPYFRMPGQFYVEGFFGASTVDIEPQGGGDDTSTTDLIGGVNVGYLMDDWLAFQLGYGHIGGDNPTDLFTAGMRNSVNMEPFNYFFSLDAELYSPDGGSSRFGIVPGVGAEMVLNDHLQVGLRYQRDFIFADDNIGINRFTARVQLKF